jgi:hypothetical protein
MSNGTYGIVTADITPEDVEIFYHFPSRDKIGNASLIKLILKKF